MSGRKPTLIGKAALALLLPLALSSCYSGSDKQPPASAWDKVPPRSVPTDHSSFFQQPFADGPSVTKACLECHPKSAEEVMATAHWNWVGDEVMVPGHDQPLRIGKRNLINNFCIGIKSNWPGCTQCHIGYGWEDESFDFTDQTRVDCLACHDNSGTYRKKFRGAGLPDESVDLLVAARSVGVPTRGNCGACHFQGGGDNAVKHGDLDYTLMFPSGRIDTHMGDHDLQCVDCHRGERHLVPGRAMSVSVDRENRLHCTACHAEQPHADQRLNGHTERVACAACHIPFMAVDTGTKMTWDWSQAGQDLDITDSHLYMKIKGRFTWAKKVPPEYYWYNETATRYILGDKIDPTKPTIISGPLGARDDPTAKLWPFKVHRGKQVYDLLHNYFLLPHVHGEQGFWNQLDWPTALEIGSKFTGLDFSGQWDFAPTEMFFPLAHMVTRADEAMQCRDCHGERGRLDWAALGYESDPVGRAVEPHEPVYLFDENGDPVVESGLPMSPRESCGACHELDEEAFVQTHGYHSNIDEELLEPQRQALLQQGPRIPADETQQMNCFMCHIARPNYAERARALAAGLPEWSVSATLIGTGLLTHEDEDYLWNTELIAEDGETEMALGAVSEANCGACHGVVHDGAEPLLVELVEGDAWTTAKTGQVFSPQRIRRSAMNLVGKDGLELAWDVHAERVVSCGDCHYSRGRPERLSGAAAKPLVDEGVPGGPRRCESCHSLGDSHDWLEEKERHLRAVACESCHVPELEMAAQQQLDRTVLRLDGKPLATYRGVISGDVTQPSRVLIGGYKPLLRVGRDSAGEARLMPYNLVASWYWIDDTTGARVTDEQLRAAWMEGDGYAPTVLQVFDSNGDNALDDFELRLDVPEKTDFIAVRLRGAGVAHPVVRGELRAYHIHHNVRHGDRVNRDCLACHPEESQPSAVDFPLAPYLPGGVVPTLLEDATQIALDGELRTKRDGGLVLSSQRGAAASYQKLQHDTE